MADLIGKNRKGDTLMCYFWGETDRPVVVLAKTTEEVRKAIADNWTGELDGDEIDEAMLAIENHDFFERASIAFEFEIGGAKFQDVFS